MMSSSQRHSADLHISGAWILTMDDHMNDYQQGSILIKDKRFTYVGAALTTQELAVEETIDASSFVLMPPFFNAHAHAAMSLLRGFKNDVNLHSWLADYIWPAESKIINKESVFLGTLLSGIEMVKAGVNLFADMYFFQDEVAKAAQEIGIRAILGEAVLDFPTPSLQSPEEAFSHAEHLVNTFKHDPLIGVSIPAHAPYTCSTKVLQEISKTAQKLGITATIHLSETSHEVKESLNKHGRTPPAYLAHIGFLDSPVVCFHCTHLNTQDISILQNSNVSVVSLPNSNALLGSGLAPIIAMKQAGLNLAVGTDGAASNNNQCVLNDLQLLVKQQKLIHQDPTVLSAKEALRFATINGAKAYRMDSRIGSIETGKEADFILIDTDQLHMQPLYDPYAQIVYSMQSDDVHSMMIHGNFVLRNRQVQGIDEQAVIQQVQTFSRRIQ